MYGKSSKVVNRKSVPRLALDDVRIGFQVVSRSRVAMPLTGREVVMTAVQPYSDKLIQITGDHIVFPWYYFPFGSRTVPLSDIEYITPQQPSMATGRWRLWGTGDFSSWFPCDWSRPSRDVIFHAKLKGKSRIIGFTVEDSWTVLSLFREMGLLSSDSFREGPASDKKSKPRISRKWLVIIFFIVLIPIVVPLLIIVPGPKWLDRFRPASPLDTISAHKLYSDEMIDITDDYILFRWYSFPLASPRLVPFSDISCVTTSTPTLENGKWRIWGGGSTVWFPYDADRPRRDTIFHLKLKGESQWIGFTVEDTQKVLAVLRDKNVLK